MRRSFNGLEVNNRAIFVLLLLLITMALICIAPKNIVLAQSSIGVDLDKSNIEKDQTITLTVDTENPDISAFTLQIYFDMTKLEYVNKTENSNFSGNRVIYTWVDQNLKDTNTAKTEEFTFKAIGNGTANIVVTGEFYDKNGNQISLDDGSTEITIGKQEDMIITTESTENGKQVSSSNTNLKIMRLNEEGISPEFQKDIKEYYFIADNSINSLKVTAIPENAKSQVTVTGNTNLKMGLNTIRIEVVSEDKTKKAEYKIYVTKTKNKELANANLENLAIKEGMLYPAFDASITKYDIEVANDVNDLTILAMPEKMSAKVTITGGNDLKVGNNTITIRVDAEDGITMKKYVITAHRRSEEEELHTKEEQEKQAEQLSTILEEDKEEQMNDDRQVKEEENGTKMSIQDIITFVLLGIVVLGFLVAFVVHKYKSHSK